MNNANLWLISYQTQKNWSQVNKKAYNVVYMCGDDNMTYLSMTEDFEHNASNQALSEIYMMLIYGIDKDYIWRDPQYKQEYGKMCRMFGMMVKHFPYNIIEDAIIKYSKNYKRKKISLDYNDQLMYAYARYCLVKQMIKRRTDYGR